MPLPPRGPADRTEKNGLAASGKNPVAFPQRTDQGGEQRLEGTHSWREPRALVGSESGCSSVNTESGKHQGQTLSYAAGITGRAHTQLCGQGSKHSPSGFNNEHLTDPAIVPALLPLLY